MAWIITKYLLSAGVVVLISEVAKRSDKLGAMIAALPIVTLLAMIWLHVENQPKEKITNYAWYTFWYVLPTLPIFLAFPFLHQRLGFWLSLASCAAISVVCFILLASLLKPFGIDIL
jgi:uncharacterized membrane protein (GlpM family)